MSDEAQAIIDELALDITHHMSGPTFNDAITGYRDRILKAATKPEKGLWPLTFDNRENDGTQFFARPNADVFEFVKEDEDGFVSYSVEPEWMDKLVVAWLTHRGANVDLSRNLIEAWENEHDMGDKNSKAWDAILDNAEESK